MAEREIKNPTYFEHVRHFFDDKDHECMFPRKWDFTTYETLRANASDVFTATEPPNASMPKDGRKWSQERSNTFLNWMDNDFPIGTPKTRPLSQSTASRIRRNAANVANDQAALKKLKAAFIGIMKLPRKDPNSYFALAAIHQLPENPGGGGLYCEHHEMLYNPWHRAYMNRFEDALRTVPGCEDVTLPYWDITQPPPDFLFKAPFKSYKLPIKIGDGYPKGYETKRYSKNRIVRQLNNAVYEVPTIIGEAMKNPVWRDFVSYTKRGIEAAHDNAHVAIGETLEHPDAAAFDPIFWFFHCNWDRLWWEWQQHMSATTRWSFRSTIMGRTRFLDHRRLNKLEPFNLKTNDVIDLNALDIGYEITPAPTVPLSENIVFASTSALRRVEIRDESRASVRIKNINRAKIPGSFQVFLKAGRKTVGVRTFFQPTRPEICPGCKERAEISLDFLVDIDSVRGKKLDFEIVTVGNRPRKDRLVDKKTIGDPTVNIRLLMQEA